MATTIESPHETRTHLPGEFGVWLFIVSDMIIFGLFFILFVYDRALDVPLYSQSQATLNQAYGAVNTILMLSSSWFVALAIHAARDNLSKFTSFFIMLAGVCGLAFVMLKFFEYSEKFSAGYFITSNDFYMYYYMLTGIHLLHVVIGIGVLTFLWHTSRTESIDAKCVNTLESGASFWHMVDMLWIVLFALLYLMK
ncbi:MAG: nitric oxide reductase NorE protein [Gammaproteobacteria bacterium]|jgi:nitric oxide reductase NorE protein